LRRSAGMQYGAGHPKGCMVALGVMSATGPDNAAVTGALTASRARTRAGFLASVERGIAQGDLAADTNPQALAAVFDSFLLGVSTLARDGVPHEQVDAAITQVMRLWDVAAVRT